MECYRCGTVVDGEDFCPNCGADIGLYRRILAAADACYNDGLEKAQVIKAQIVGQQIGDKDQRRVRQAAADRPDAAVFLDHGRSLLSRRSGVYRQTARRPPCPTDTDIEYHIPPQLSTPRRKCCRAQQFRAAPYS